MLSVPRDHDRAEKPKRRASKPKVRTGCLTCKIRHKKCDETKPVCNNCSSTRRICDGYLKHVGPGNDRAVVGGNNLSSDSSESSANSRSTSLTRQASSVPHSPSDLTFKTDDEYAGFCSFKVRTARQIYAASHDDVWITTVLQLSHRIEAVRHAVIALGNLSKRFQGSSVMHSDDEVAARFDRLALESYQKSLSGLSQSLSQRASPGSLVKETLITCVLFIIFEFLRGGEQAVIMHLSSGARLIEQHEQSLADESSLLRLFTQLQLLMAMWLGLPNLVGRLPPNFTLLETAEDTPAAAGDLGLDSMQEQLVSISNEVQGMSLAHASSQDGDCDTAVRARERVRMLLNAWDIAFENQISVPDPGNQTQISLIRLERLQVDLMLNACGPTDNSSESQEATCSTILTIAATLLEPTNTLKWLPMFTRIDSIVPPVRFANPSTSLWQDAPAANELVPLFCFPVGAIEPLYYVALHAPAVPLKLRAIELMEREPWREGAWDSSVMARIARRRLKGLDKAPWQSGLY